MIEVSSQNMKSVHTESDQTRPDHRTGERRERGGEPAHPGGAGGEVADGVHTHERADAGDEE